MKGNHVVCVCVCGRFYFRSGGLEDGVEGGCFPPWQDSAPEEGGCEGEPGWFGE